MNKFLDGVVLPEVNRDLEPMALPIDESAYHAMKNFVHSSSLKHMIKSPHAYLWNLKFPKPQTPSTRLGTLGHKAILEGRHFLEDYIVEPIHVGFTKDGKETTSKNAISVQQAALEWRLSLKPNQKIVSQDEYDSIGFMMDSLLSHKFVQEIFKDGSPEVRGQFSHEKTGIGCVFANDFLTTDLNTWIDLKTCADSSQYAFSRSVEKFRYDLQCAIYNKGNEAVFGKNPKEKVWIAVENVPPYETRVHHVDPFYEESGLYEFNQCMHKLSECLKSGNWPQGQNVVETLEPSFGFRNYYDLRMV